MGLARKLQLLGDMDGCYHVWIHCASHRYLGGTDKAGRILDHRKIWVEERLAFLTGQFAVEVPEYATMDTHFHAIAITRPSWVREWSDEEVATRWDCIQHGVPITPEQESVALGRIQATLVDGERLAVLRERLSSLSWFMRKLDERLAQLANQEDGCEGHFWVGRFRSRPLMDEEDRLEAMEYVALNPVRAGSASLPEEGPATGFQLRAEAWVARHILKRLKAGGGSDGEVPDSVDPGGDLSAPEAEAIDSAPLEDCAASDAGGVSALPCAPNPPCENPPCEQSIRMSPADSPAVHRPEGAGQPVESPETDRRPRPRTPLKGWGRAHRWHFLLSRPAPHLSLCASPPEGKRLSRENLARMAREALRRSARLVALPVPAGPGPFEMAAVCVEEQAFFLRVDHRGRLKHPAKPGFVSSGAPPILERLESLAQRWLESGGILEAGRAEGVI